MNKVILLGNLCKDIEVRYTPNNKMVITNSIGVRNDYKNANGEYDSIFVNIQVWNHNAEYLSKYAKKGSRILVEGRLNTRTYENEQKEKKYITEVICESVSILDSKKETDGAEQSSTEATTKTESDPFEEFGNEVEISDDDLPF